MKLMQKLFVAFLIACIATLVLHGCDDAPFREAQKRRDYLECATTFKDKSVSDIEAVCGKSPMGQ